MTAQPNRIAAHIKIYGQVQGVGFRYQAFKKAKELELGGWVKNCGNDCVEIVCEGEAEKVLVMRSWAEGGPASARVDRALVQETPVSGFQDFEIYY